MGSVTIEVSGPDSVRLARELWSGLAAVAGPGDSISPVEVERSAELVVAIISLVLSAPGTAKTIWDWWRAHESQRPTVKIHFSDGFQLDLSGIDQQQLEIELNRRATKES